jgi:integrase/recombinase XerD
MQSLPIQTTQYNYLLSSYTTYLETLGYAKSTIKSFPIHVREFLHYLEMHNIKVITKLDPNDINAFIKHIKQRSSKRYAGTVLSSSSINKIINAVNGFIRFLNTTGKYTVESSAERAESSVSERFILTIDEVNALYEASFEPYRENSIAMGQRDRAIIAVFYGCGLRRSEAKQLNITDIDIEKKLLFVRKGKGNKQRYVPIASKHVEDIRDYLREAREWFLYSHVGVAYKPPRKKKPRLFFWGKNRHGFARLRLSLLRCLCIRKYFC